MHLSDFLFFLFQNPSWESVQFTPWQFEKYAALPSILIISYPSLSNIPVGEKGGGRE